MTIQGAITEHDIANYLANTPGFFERHAELLATIQLTSPHGGRAVSLQERQMQMLRDRIKQLERQWMGMVRNAQDNEAIADRLHGVVLSLLATADAAALPGTLLSALQEAFLIPQAAIRLWGADSTHAGEPFAQPVSDDARSFAGSLALPYCGVNAGFEAVSWLPDPSSVMSVAMIPLRLGADDGAFGLLVLGSPDPTRYAAEMGTEFLMRIGEVSSAALSRLRVPA